MAEAGKFGLTTVLHPGERLSTLRQALAAAGARSAPARAA
jgi:hypothetical protein